MMTVFQDGKMSLEGFKKAKTLGMCIRCSLRFSGIEQMDIYRTKEAELNDTLTHLLLLLPSSPPITVEEETLSICTCCLGLLSDSFLISLQEQMKQKVKETQYEVTSFALSMKLPAAVLIREFSLLYHFRQQLQGFHHHRIIDLKDVLKEITTLPISLCFDDTNTNTPLLCTNSSDFNVLLEFSHQETEEEAKQIPAVRQQLEQVTNRKRRRGPPPILDGFGCVKRGIAALNDAIFFPSSIICPPNKCTTSHPIIKIHFERDSIYLQGRYLKFMRGLSQTPWVIDGKRMGDSSVEECIGDILLPFFQGTSYKFHTAGREDVDVRMLGNGRPFILEILDAKKKNTLSTEMYTQMQHKVNLLNQHIIEIRLLKPSTKEYFASLQAGADSKKKTYCCVVWTSKELTQKQVEKLDAIHDLTIAQKTPIRVLHRRTLLTRPKIIHQAKCQVLNKHFMLLRLTTSAGTYVKEFVHGDLGRTEPNVGSILECDADILQLDVENLIDAA